MSYYVFCFNALFIDQKTGAYTVTGFGPSVSKQIEEGKPKREACRSAQTFQEATTLYPLLTMPGSDGKRFHTPDKAMAFDSETHQAEYSHWQEERKRAFDEIGQ